jgi:hypothetical protein
VPRDANDLLRNCERQRLCPRYASRMIRPIKPFETATLIPFNSFSYEEARPNASSYDPPSGARKNQSYILQPLSQPGQPASMSLAIGRKPMVVHFVPIQSLTKTR